MTPLFSCTGSRSTNEAMLRFSTVAAIIVSLIVTQTQGAFVSPIILRKHTFTPCSSFKFTPCSSMSDNQDGWDDDVNYDDFLSDDSNKSSPDPSLDWNAAADDDTPKLGIDIGKQLEPLSEKEAAELKAEATEMINERFAEGLDDIAKLRENMQKEIESSRKAMELASELNAQRESEKLLKKIDSLTSGLMESTKSTRESTKLAAAADRATGKSGDGVDMGSWGVLGDAVVVTSGGTADAGLLGSVDAARRTFSGKAAQEGATAVAPPQENRILIVADESSDNYAKLVVPAFISLLEKAIAGIDVQVLKPTTTMPLGGNNAQCLIVFCTSLTDRSVLTNSILDRVLRKTLMGQGQVSSPPTQLVCVSTLGTERFDKFPYSMQNLMGGKLEKRRQMEEAVVSAVQNRVVEPPLDYTIVKLGEIKDNSNEFQMAPGDVLDGTITSDAAAQVLLQAVAYQPTARNATLCAVGSSPTDFDDGFLRLDGPELWRTGKNLGSVEYTDQLVEYLTEWAEMLQENKKLTTPVRAVPSTKSPNPYQHVKERHGVRLEFLPTKTGSAYQSKSEERAREREMSSPSSSTATADQPSTPRRQKKEGGVEVLVEVTDDDELRVRARRCNMQDDTVLKELSEATILKRLQEAMNVWKSDHAKS